MADFRNIITMFAIICPLLGCEQSVEETLVLEYDGEVIGVYDDVTGTVAFHAAPELLTHVKESLAGEAQLSFHEYAVDIPADLAPVQFVPGLTPDDIPVLVINEYSREATFVSLPTEELNSIFDGTLQLKRGNKKKGDTCTEHWHSGQKNKDKDCKWPWNCYGPYAASHPKWGDGVSARCVCHF